MVHVPFLLTLLRLLLAPVVIALAWSHPSRAAFAVCMVAAFVSDVFDGVIARRLGVATAGLRRFDSLADSIFYLAVLAAVWKLYPEILRQYAVALGALVALELLRYLYDFLKFRREASYHLWSSKLWGLSLFLALFSLLALDWPSVLLPISIWLGCLADLEGLLVSITLRQWQHDVPTLFHALKQR